MSNNTKMTKLKQPKSATSDNKLDRVENDLNDVARIISERAEQRGLTDENIQELLNSPER
ncbi:MAG: hypothetical protein ACPGUC_01160 [Gammaproteobacteria bacterium]